MRRGNVIELFGNCAAEFGDRTALEHAGRELTYAYVSMDDYAAVASEQDVPEDVIWLLR